MLHSGLGKNTHNRVQASQSSTDSQTTETSLRDGGINHPLRAKSVQQTSCHLVPAGKRAALVIKVTSTKTRHSSHCTDRKKKNREALRSVVLCDLLTQNESFRVALQLLRQSLVQSITDIDLLDPTFRRISSSANK